MINWIGVLPYVYKPYFDECIATMHPYFKERILFINNTLNNVGIMKSHNMGIDFMKEKNAEFLVIISAAIRFGTTGGLDFIKQIEDHIDHHVIHAASENVIGGKQEDPTGGGHNEVFGWHLTAFNRNVFETIGRWDENFTPYGFDDIDISLRIRKAFRETTVWNTYPCDVHDTRMSHGLSLAPEIVGEAASEPRIAYFVNKWGRHPGAWQWDGWEHPFNNPENSLNYWPPAPNGGRCND